MPNCRTRLTNMESRKPDPVAAVRPAGVAVVAGETRPTTARSNPPAARPADIVTVLNNQRDMLKDPEYRKARWRSCA